MKSFAPIDLNAVSVASPCSASWGGMEGDDKVRFCRACSRNVYNLSSLSYAEAEQQRRDREGRMCVRFFRRSDGTLLTSDCPVGARRLRLWFAGIWAAALAVAVLMVAITARFFREKPLPILPFELLRGDDGGGGIVMGEMVCPGDVDVNRDNQDQQRINGRNAAK